MPRSKQIIPMYTFPHEETYINDYSAQDLTEEVVAVTRANYISVFAGPKGVDGKLVYADSAKSYQKMFGDTNYTKYGQPHMMPLAYLSSANTGVWCLRVMPDDASYSNSVLSLWFKADKEKKAFRIKFTAKSLSAEQIKAAVPGVVNPLMSRKLLIELGAKMDGTLTDGVYKDAEGYTQVPMAVFTPIGRGAYGKNMRWRITANQEYEKEYTTKFFNFEILDVTNGVTVVQHNTATIMTNPALGTSNFINDVIADMNEIDNVADIHIFEDNMDYLYEQYVAFCDEMAKDAANAGVVIPEKTEFDPFFGKENKDMPSEEPKALPYIKFTKVKTADVTSGDEADYTEMDIIAVDAIAGNSFDNGSDGAFANADAAARQKSIEDMYEKAFLGEVDKLILSAKRIPAQALYDANYSFPVKKAMAKLALHRLSCPLYLDTNFTESLSVLEIKTLAAKYQPIQDLAIGMPTVENSSNFICSVNMHDYKIVEASTGKRVRVTFTYFLALTDAEYRAANEVKTIPRTGVNCTLSGHIRNSLSPAVDESEFDIKQALKDARINYVESIGINRFERATEMTFIQPPAKNMSVSDLGLESNMIAILDLKVKMEEDFRINRNSITTPDRRRDFRLMLLAKYDYMKGNKFDNFDIMYKANQFESKRNITHAYVGVSFYPRSEVTLIEIDVNEKTYREDSEN